VHVGDTPLHTRRGAGRAPPAAAPHARLRAMREVAAAGVPVGVMIAPVIPMINDHEIEAILEAAREAGAQSAGYVLLRLPHELKEIWREWLQLHHPDRAAHVMSLVQQMRGGRDYDSGFVTRMRGQGPFAQLIEARFLRARRRLGYGRMPALETSHFRVPAAAGDQGQLF
jgi:DNA repair photolyase